MGNMSYCRFENTAQDLSDCYEAIQNGETTELNDYETRGLEELLELCKNIMTYEDELEQIINENKNK